MFRTEIKLTSELLLLIKTAWLGSALRGARFLYSVPALNVTPKNALVDDKVVITVSGLTRRQKVTIQAVLEEKCVFISGGHFLADDKGQLNVAKQQSLGGTYKGIDAMGLFWSMKPAQGEPPYTRISKRDVESPFLVHLRVLDGHVDVDSIPTPTSTSASAIASTCLERWYMDKGVTRLPIREQGVRGTLFLPPGRGPFPGVIDMFGTTGGIIESRAALLASRGFATLSLAYFAFEDLVPHVSEIDFDYFLQALDWLCGHPSVLPGGVGVFGVSKGAELGMVMAIHSAKVKAVVSVNGAQTYTACDLMKGGTVLHKGAPFELDKAVMNEEGLFLKECCPSWSENILPIWESGAHVLWLLGEDDQSWDSGRARVMFDRLTTDQQEKITLQYYQGAGHLIEPPYTPHFRYSFHAQSGFTYVWGGHPKPHAAAQEDAWHRALRFLRQHLGQAT